MYTKINHISQSKIGFSANNNSLFVPKKEKGFIVYNLVNSSLQVYNTDYDVFEILILSDEKFVVTEGYARTGFIYTLRHDKWVLSNDLSEYTVLGVSMNLLNVRTREIVEDSKVKTPALYDWKKDEILWQKNYGLNFVSGYIIAKTNHSEYSRLSPPTGEIIWSYSFADYPKVKDEYGKETALGIHSNQYAFMGVVDNQLWVRLNSCQYLVLDIETGRKLALLGDAYNGRKYTNNNFGTAVIDTQNKKVILLSNHTYTEFSTETFEYNHVDLSGEFNSHGVSSGGRTFLDDDYIYFYDKVFFGEQPRNKVAVLDRNTLKVVWVHDFAQYGTFPMQMEKTERHLFVLDSGGTLHIFEREPQLPQTVH